MKKLSLLALVVLMVVIVTACGSPRPLNEKNLAEIIPSQIAENMDIKKVTIDRRQTNGKEDTVYAIIDMEDASVHRTAYYVLTLNYYDKGGWMIDNWDRYQNSEAYPVGPPSEEIALRPLEYKYKGYSISLISADTENFKSGKVTFTFDVSKEQKYAIDTGKVVVECRMIGGWSSNIVEDTVDLKWKSEALAGKWEATWYDPDHKADNYPVMTFTMNITEITDTVIRADGRVTRIDDMDKSGNCDFDKEFEGEFEYSEYSTYHETKELATKVVTARYNGYSNTYSFIVVFSMDGAAEIRYNNLRGPFPGYSDDTKTATYGGSHMRAELHKTVS